ncbi:kinase-like domain-containing protein [Mortierella sp. GBAus27b]|nr:kinase subunit of RNA polymerase II carboxy-terminal domain kinase I [Mortierella sp. GBA43]KAI8352208.1 kinase-like domain-containing protein [Mortierella sp. GBAus27b]
MAQPTVPKLGYPCLAKSTDSLSLVGLQFAPTDSNSTDGTAYTIQSYSATISSISKSVQSSTIVPFKAVTTQRDPVKPTSNSRMICAQDPTSGTLLYIFNENVYLENPGSPDLATTDPIKTWDPLRNSGAQAVWPTGVRGQFQWLGVSSGNWTLFDIDAKGVTQNTTLATKPVPADIPAANALSIVRELAGSFVVFYRANSTLAARFNLGDSVSTPIPYSFADLANIQYKTAATAQDTKATYYMSSDDKYTFTAEVKYDSTNVTKLSTREYPVDNNGRVPTLYTYATAATFDNYNALIYGGQTNATSNSWSFQLTAVNTEAGRNFNNYTIFTNDTTPGTFNLYVPPPPKAEDDSKGLSTAAIIGIAVGAVALVMLIVLFIIFHRRNKKIEAREREQEGLDMAVRDLNAKSGGAGMSNYQPRFASTHSLLDSETTTSPRGQTSVSTDRPAENLTLRVPIVRYDGRDVAQSVPNAPLGAVVLSQYRLGQTAVNTTMVVIQLGENVDTAESVTLKWVRDEIVWQREAAMLNHIVNPAKIISLHQTMIIPAALEWRHILVLDAHESTLNFMLSTHHQRLLNRPDQKAVAKAVLGGLNWCHEKDVIHLSICTGSLVLNEEGQWVLWSFGGARFLNEAVGPRQGSQIGQEDGAVERNLSPELLGARREERLDTTLAAPAMDAWAAGCVLFEVLTGQSLFRTEEAADQAATGKFNAWRDRMGEITDDNERKVVEGLLVLDPAARLTLSQALSLFV